MFLYMYNDRSSTSSHLCVSFLRIMVNLSYTLPLVYVMCMLFDVLNMFEISKFCFHKHRNKSYACAFDFKMLLTTRRFSMKILQKILSKWLHVLTIVSPFVRNGVHLRTYIFLNSILSESKFFIFL